MNRYIRKLLSLLFRIGEVATNPPVNGPYRTPSIKEPEPIVMEPKKPFNERHPKMSKMIKRFGLFGLGIITIACTIGTLWVLFPGMFKLGMWLANDIFHWYIVTENLPGNGYPVAGWLIGIIFTASPALIYYACCFTHYIGKCIFDKTNEE